jgi:site-specific DNA-methyltransferase (adenine-specific)
MINNIHQGCCLETMKQIEEKSISMVFLDLPYGITENHWDKKIDLNLLWKEIERIIKPKTAIVFTATQPFSSELIQSKSKWFRHEWIWEKDNGSNPFLVKKMPFIVHEHILVFGKESPCYYPQKAQGKKPYQIKVSSKFSHLSDRTLRIPIDNKGDRYPRSVIKFSRDYGKSIHSSQKPVALVEHLIKSYSLEGDIILDPVSGSGSTAIAAVKSGRNFICIEKDPIYHKNSIERLDNFRKDAHGKK